MEYRIRAAHVDDVEALYAMAKLTGGGFTNLPPDRRTLGDKLERSAASFARDPAQAGRELFVMMLEHVPTGAIKGTCQIFARVGVDWPFYSYRIGSISQHSQELGRTFRADMLSLVTDLEGASEVGGLFLDPNARAGGLGLLLARSRYLFIAMHRACFADRILAELRGVIDDAGGSPFWDGVAGRFFGMNFQAADEFNALHGNQFIADLMPKHPVYIAMLSDSARSVIGLPHPTGRAAMRMLEGEGFAFEDYVDIFDGGPTMTARTDNVHSIRDSAATTIAAIVTDNDHTADPGQRALVATGAWADYRCCFAHVRQHGDGIAIEAGAATALGVEPGATVSWVAC